MGQTLQNYNEKVTMVIIFFLIDQKSQDRQETYKISIQFRYNMQDVWGYIWACNMPIRHCMTLLSVILSDSDYMRMNSEIIHP